MVDLDNIILSSDIYFVQASGMEVGRIVFVDSKTLETKVLDADELQDENFKHFENIFRDKDFVLFQTGTALVLRCKDQYEHYFDLFQFKDGVDTVKKKEQLIHYSNQVVEEHKRMKSILNGFNEIGFITL